MNKKKWIKIATVIAVVFEGVLCGAAVILTIILEANGGTEKFDPNNTMIHVIYGLVLGSVVLDITHRILKKEQNSESKDL